LQKYKKSYSIKKKFYTFLIINNFKLKYYYLKPSIKEYAVKASIIGVKRTANVVFTQKMGFLVILNLNAG